MAIDSNQHKSIRTIGYLGVFISLIGILMLMPLLTNRYYSFIGLQGCLAILLTSLNYSISLKNNALRTGFWVVFAFVLLDCLGLYTDSIYFMIMAYMLFAAFISYAIYLLLKVIFKAPVIDNNLIFAAITVYFLMGMLWGKIYFLDILLFPNSFNGIHHVVNEASHLGTNFDIQFDLLYYSYTTLATLGIGDITPTHHLSKSLTILEAMLGQLFVAVVIAKTVSIWRHEEPQMP